MSNRLKRSVQKKIVVVVLAVCVLLLVGFVPTQTTAWRKIWNPVGVTEGGKGVQAFSALVAGLLTLVLGFIVAWLVAWIVQLRGQRTPTGPIWSRVLIGAAGVALLLLVLLFSPLADLTTLHSGVITSPAVITWTPPPTVVIQLPTYTAYPTYTPAPTYTPVPTYTPLPTHTPAPTYTPPPTWTPSKTPTRTPTATPTWTPTSTPTRRLEDTPTSTATATLTPTLPSPTSTATATPAPLPTTIVALPVTGMTPRQVVRVLVIVLLAVLLIGGGIWEVQRQQQK